MSAHTDRDATGRDRLTALVAASTVGTYVLVLAGVSDALADAALPPTNDAFGGVVETIIAVVAIVFLVRRRWGVGQR